MIAKNAATIVVMLVCISFVQGMAIDENSEPSERETQEYRQELARVRAMRRSLTPGLTNDLGKYEKFVDEIQHKWSQRNKKYYARLMVNACGPLSSGNFKDDRRHELARKYALSALENPDEIPLTLELEATVHVLTPMMGLKTPRPEDFAQRRKKDVEVRLHAWKRLMDAVDPNWALDLNDPPCIGEDDIATELGLPARIAPEDVGDATLRAKYEAAIRKRRQRVERDLEQNRLHKWLKKFPKRAEIYITRIYSYPPFNVAELEKSLNDYAIDEKTKTRILDTVTKNCEKAKAEEREKEKEEGKEREKE